MPTYYSVASTLYVCLCVCPRRHAAARVSSVLLYLMVVVLICLSNY